MEPGFIGEEECIQYQNITTCVVTTPSTKLLFSGNQPTLTHVESKFCIGKLWNEVYMSICAKALPAAPVVKMWWGVPKSFTSLKKFREHLENF